MTDAMALADLRERLARNITLFSHDQAALLTLVDAKIADLRARAQPAVTTGAGMQRLRDEIPNEVIERCARAAARSDGQELQWKQYIPETIAVICALPGDVRCVGCGSNWNSADLAAAKAADPKIISCCPERKPLDITGWMARAIALEEKLRQTATPTPAPAVSGDVREQLKKTIQHAWDHSCDGFEIDTMTDAVVSFLAALSSAGGTGEPVAWLYEMALKIRPSDDQPFTNWKQMVTTTPPPTLPEGGVRNIVPLFASLPKTDPEPGKADDVSIAEIWHGSRKITLYLTEIIRVWGVDIDKEMSSETLNIHTAQEAFDWLYEAAALQQAPGTDVAVTRPDREAPGSQISSHQGSQET